MLLRRSTATSSLPRSAGDAGPLDLDEAVELSALIA